ncbi:MAG: hypothetical protein ACREI9_09340 [Nitrospiraceae bacterium]
MDRVDVQTVNFDEVQQAFNDAPLLTFKFVKQEFKRNENRFRKAFIRARMSGAPGIMWGKRGKNVKQVGGNVRAFTKDDGSLGSLSFTARISRLLRTHEEGATLTPKTGGALAIALMPGLPHKVAGAEQMFGQKLFKVPGTHLLAIKEGEAVKPLYVLVPSVTIPARLGFVNFWKASVPEFKGKIRAAMQRAMGMAFDRRMKKIGSLVSRIEAA